MCTAGSHNGHLEFAAGAVTYSKLSTKTASWVAASAVGLVIVVAKVYKLGETYTKIFQSWKVVLLAVAILASVIAVVYVLDRYRHQIFDNRKRIWLATGGLVVGGLFLEIAVILFVRAMDMSVGSGKVYFVVYKAASVFRWDIVFLGWLALAFQALRRPFRRHCQSVGQLIIWSATYVLMLIVAIDLAYFATTRSMGNWFLLQYAIQQWHFVGAPVIAESKGTLVAVFVAPALLTMSAWLFTRSTHAGGGTEPTLRPISTVFVLLALTGVASIWPERFLEDKYRLHTSNLFADLFASAWQPTVETNPRRVSVDPGDVPFYGPDFEVVAPAQSWRARSLVLVILESARAASAPPWNRDGIVMPFLTGLAEKSTVVRRMYTSVPFTAEALVALLHGVHPPSADWEYYGRIDKPAVPKVLNAMGYTSAFFTGAELSEVRKERAMLTQMGFDVVSDSRSLAKEGFESLPYGGYEDRIMLRPAADWLRNSVDAGRPFFLVLLTQQSHHPYRVPSDFPRKSFNTDMPSLEDYLNSLYYTDNFLRDFFELLVSDERTKDAILLVVGDHGQAFDEHGFRFHGHHVWEEVIRVPFIIYDPLAEDSPREVPGPYQLVDVFPTVIDLLRLSPIGTRRAGHSVLGDRVRETVYVSGSAMQSMALVTDSLKYIYSYRRHPLKVYSLESDEREMNDLGQTLPSEIHRQVEMQLILWQERVNNQFGADSLMASG